MQFTGERFVPGVTGLMKLEHLQRYALCRELVRGKRTLDVASGEGYGAAMLAATAAHVVGVDVSVDAVRHARDSYASVGNLQFVAGRCEAIPLASQSVDVVVSFETIEHIERHAALLDEITRVLTPGGRLVISSPDRHGYAVSAPAANPFHVKELSLDEFEALLRARFLNVRMWGQRPAVGTFSYSLSEQVGSSESVAALAVEDAEVRSGLARLAVPVYCIGVCSDADLDDVRFDSVILDPSDDYYATLAATIRGYEQIAKKQQAVGPMLEAAYAADKREWAAKRSQLEAQIERLAEEAGRLAEEHERDRRHHLELLDRQRQELDVVYASMSWRLTAPVRDTRRSIGRLKHSVALRLERAFRTAYRRLPIRSQHRWKIKSAVYARTGWLMKGTSSYQHWHGTYSRARGDDRTPLARSLSGEGAPGAQSFRLPSSDNPVVSVIVPVFGQLDHTWRCLASIARHPPTVPVEVIVVDDGSPDNMRSALAKFEGLRVVRNDRNSGFIESCNHGARLARGRLLFFLNNDTEVLPGWCDELADTFAAVPQAGIVGSKLLYPDGRLQEAGGIIWRDGSGWNVGKFDDPSKPEYSYRREVDYVSGAALMVPAALFWEVGGFDAHYAPAYGEDSDLAFKARAAGRSVLYQPLSQVVHYEGVTSGTDVGGGVKAYQVQNERKLYERWRQELASHQEAGQHVALAKERGVGLRVLVLDLCTPEPDKDAGSITAFNIMRILQRLDCKVTFAPVDNYLFLDRYTPELQRMGIECLHAPFVISIEDYLRQHGHLFDVVLIFRFMAAKRHLSAVRRLAPQAKVVLHTSDLHFLREEREAEVRDDPRIVHRAARMKQDELDIIGRVDCTVVHSTFEQALLEREAPGARVIVFGWAIDVPGTTVPFEARRDVAFIGGYQHPPNVDGALFFAREILPLVRRQVPDVRFHVVGSNPPAELQALQGETITVTGFVPDLGPLLDRMRLSVAPLRYGAGIKGKIGTSLSHGLPCVATPMGVEGMALAPESEVLVATTPEEFAASVVRAYTDSALWSRLSTNGQSFVRSQYSFDGATALFKGLLQSLGLNPGLPAPTVRQRDGLEMAVASSSAADREHRDRSQSRFVERQAIEDALLPSGERLFAIDGFCIACRRPQAFSVDFEHAVNDAHGRRVPNWQEQLVCSCGLNARTRAVVHLLTMTLRAPADARMYVLEQSSLLQTWLKERFSGVVTSEGPDAAHLPLGDARCDFIVSLEAFAHLPDPTAAIAEAYRCLDFGGTLILAVPFDRDSEVTRQPAAVYATGEIEHQPGPDVALARAGIDRAPHLLCFGWDLVETLKSAGFSSVHARFLWSRRLGYLGDEHVLFTAVK